MTINDALRILNVQLILHRTPSGRKITDLGLEAIRATLDDQKQYDQPVVQCLNCKLIVSSLLVTDKCPNCGALDLTMEIDPLENEQNNNTQGK